MVCSKKVSFSGQNIKPKRPEAIIVTFQRNKEFGKCIKNVKCQPTHVSQKPHKWKHETVTEMT